MLVCTCTCFDTSQGFKPLTAAEIKKDVKDISKMLQEDSDSESSIKSEDIMPSNYPVKPRKTSRKNGRGNAKDMTAVEYDPKSIEEAFAFLNHIQIRKRPLYEGERIRESLENQHVVRMKCLKMTFAFNHVERSPVLSILQQDCTFLMITLSLLWLSLLHLCSRFRTLCRLH
jgi:hypothetical protein